MNKVMLDQSANTNSQPAPTIKGELSKESSSGADCEPCIDDIETMQAAINRD